MLLTDTVSRIAETDESRDAQRYRK